MKFSKFSSYYHHCHIPIEFLYVFINHKESKMFQSIINWSNTSLKCVLNKFTKQNIVFLTQKCTLYGEVTYMTVLLWGSRWPLGQSKQNTVINIGLVRLPPWQWSKDGRWPWQYLKGSIWMVLHINFELTIK